MRAYPAIAPGTDLSQHARVLERVHDAVIAGGRPPVRPRGVVARSWSNVLDLGLDASQPNAREPLPLDEVERRRRCSALALMVDELRQVLVSLADANVRVRSRQTDPEVSPADDSTALAATSMSCSGRASSTTPKALLAGR